MKKGDMVWIYEDPFTKQIPEGEARLIRLLSAHKYNQSFWLVHFTRDNSKVARMIVEDENS
jgi:hypothetical protein